VDIEYDASYLVQFIPQYEEVPIIDLKEHDARAFDIFKRELDQPLKKLPQVTFSGQLQKGKKEGKGAYHYPNGDFFYGMWLNDER
jgi:hypothetical protein